LYFNKLLQFQSKLFLNHLPEQKSPLVITNDNAYVNAEVPYAVPSKSLIVNDLLASQSV
jgi:hypothetical protein